MTDSDFIPLTLGGQPSPDAAGPVSLSLLADTLTALNNETAKLPSPLNVFALELELGLVVLLGVSDVGS